MTGWYSSVLLGDGAEACRRRFAAAPRRAVEPRASALPRVPGGAKAGLAAPTAATALPLWAQHGGAWPSHPQPNYQHSPPPQKLAVGCCLFMFAGLLNTDFSRKFGKVTVMSVNLTREPLSFLDSLWKTEYLRLCFDLGILNMLCIRAVQGLAQPERDICYCAYKHKPVSSGYEKFIFWLFCHCQCGWKLPWHLINNVQCRCHKYDWKFSQCLIKSFQFCWHKHGGKTCRNLIKSIRFSCHKRC